MGVNIYNKHVQGLATVNNKAIQYINARFL
jgi:hypothetical protein